MCNLYSFAKGEQAIRELARAMRDRTGSLPLLPGIYPDYRAPVVRNQPEGRELTMARWGMPSPVASLKGRNSDSGVTNIRNVKSPHWWRWLGIEHRCAVPFTSFSENEALATSSAAILAAFECFWADQSSVCSPLQRSHRGRCVARSPFG